MGDDQGNNLLKPGDTPHDNVQFLVFCAAVLQAVLPVTGPAARRHRQRRQRPPPGRQRGPAGDHLGLPRRHATGHLRADREGRRQEHQVGRHPRDRRRRVLPTLPRDAGDRNRTSPFAFTGNKFEFRAVSSSQSIAMPNIVPERDRGRLARLTWPTELEKATAGGQSLDAAVGKLLTKIDQGEQADHLQRQRLLGGVAEGGRQAQAA